MGGSYSSACSSVRERSFVKQHEESFLFQTTCLSNVAQPAGVPEILKKSLHSCSVKGEEEVFLIGKNFLKGTKVIFQENISGQYESSNGLG